MCKDWKALLSSETSDKVVWKAKEDEYETCFESMIKQWEELQDKHVATRVRALRYQLDGPLTSHIMHGAKARQLLCRKTVFYRDFLNDSIFDSDFRQLLITKVSYSRMCAELNRLR